MQEAEEEEGYSDDDLDALPIDTFQKLQENAIRSSQQVEEPRLPSGIRKIIPHPSRLTNKLENVAADSNNSYNSHIQNNAQEASSDYGDFDSEMLDGEIVDAAEEPAAVAGHEGAVFGRQVGESTQREQWRQQRFAPQRLQYDENHPSVDGQAVPPTHRSKTHKEHNYDEPALLPQDRLQEIPEFQEVQERAHNLTRPQSQDPAAMEKLQAQVEELLRERDNLKDVVNSANHTAQSKIGEIAIIRANQIKADKQNEQRMLMLQKQYADEAERHKLDIEKARAEQKKIATEKGFLEFDLAEGTKKIKQLEIATKQGQKTSRSKIDDGDKHTTPKKNKSLPYGDGFDDEEMQLVSPSKLSFRSKPVTPKAGTKRKRKAVESSPVKPLPLSQPKTEYAEPIVNPSKDPVEAVADTVKQDNERFQYTQKILNHRTCPDRKRSFEELAGFSYPSNPNRAISTIFLDSLSSLTFKTKLENFPAALGDIVISLWAQCIDEKYYAPAHLLLDLIKYILLISPFGTAPHFTDTIVKYAQTTADVNVIPRFKRAQVSELNPEVDTKVCLEILHLMAYGCIHEHDEIERFWRCMRFDFVVMMLHIAQPMEELHLAIGLLHTSVLEGTFAMKIPPGDGSQRPSQDVVLDRLSRLLIETPVVPTDSEPYDSAQVAGLRLHVLKLMQALCDVKHGGEALALHKDVIGRLVRVMNDELDALYDYQYGHEIRSELVNHSTRLLYHLTREYPSLIDLQAKLRVVPGGTHKYLIALTRLAFSDGVFYERAIEEDVVEFAHQMLEMLVNPQEAEALLEAFSSARK